MTDAARDLIQRLADALTAHHQLPGRVPLLNEARAYLATSEPAAGPTDEEWFADFAAWLAPRPIPLSERLPGPEDCDAEGKCWVFDQGDSVIDPAWNLTSAADLDDLRQMEAEGSLLGMCERWRLAWLPHHALPLPEVQP